MKEIWKDVVGYEGLYQISSLGRLKNRHGRILNGNINDYGYLRAILCDGKGHRKYIQIHRLVAQAFIPNPDNKPQVNHIDENKINNVVENLEWVTVKENINWGTSLQRRAEHQKITQKSKKTVYQYDKEYNLVTTYISCHEASRVCGIERTGIMHCCNGNPKFPTYKGYIWRYEKIERT